MNHQNQNSIIMKLQTTKLTLMLALCAAFIASCSKTTEPKIEFSTLSVALNTTYLTNVDVDSALVVWDEGGNTRSLKMDHEGAISRYSAPMTRIPRTATGKVWVQIFTNKTEPGNRPLQWEQEVTLPHDRATPVMITGPVGLQDAAWKPRAMFHYEAQNYKFSVLVALRPDDPYFEMKGITPFLTKKIELVRSFHDKETGALVFSRGWVCEQNCVDDKGNLVNRSHFANMPEQLQGKEWSQYRINGSFKTHSNPAEILGYGLLTNK
jgi:hypothetical protein